MTEYLSIEEIIRAGQALKNVVSRTPLMKDDILSDKYACNLYLKREDLQKVRSFKLRGAYNKMSSLNQEQLAKGVVCASAGNHAQGVAYSCKALNAKGSIFMPVTTPRQKIAQVTRFGGDFVKVILSGDTFDDAYSAAIAYCEEQDMCFIHPFNDPWVIAGQGTVAMEIMDQDIKNVDYIFVTIGGGGLAAGVGTYIKEISPQTKIIGVEPVGAASMKAAFAHGGIVSLDTIDKFVDGAAVKTVGDLSYNICKGVLDDIITVPEGKVCTSILELYNDSAIVLEPAGALSVAALDFYKDEIKNKNVVCILSGGNNDIDRMQEIKERSLLYEGLKHYFIIDFPQRPGSLKEFVVEVLGPDDDIARFEYTKSNDKEKGPTLVGIELGHPEDYQPLIQRLNSKGFQYTVLNKSPQLFNLLV
ncbi:MAG: threonine ammonia-lyase IlvA [Clostridiales bacterium]